MSIFVSFGVSFAKLTEGWVTASVTASVPFQCALLPIRILPTLAGTPDRDAMVGLSSVAGRATMRQGC